MKAPRALISLANCFLLIKVKYGADVRNIPMEDSSTPQKKLPIALILIIYFSLYEFLNEFTLDIVQYNLSTNSSSSPE